MSVGASLNATFALLGVTGLTNYYCVGSAISASVSTTNTAGQDIVTTTNKDCSTYMSTNACGMSLMTNNCTWTASVGIPKQLPPEAGNRRQNAYATAVFHLTC